MTTPTRDLGDAGTGAGGPSAPDLGDSPVLPVVPGRGPAARFVPAPRHYRYAWARNPMANLSNSRQVPIATQRLRNQVLSP